jgi:crossover junction endodeoxyribonuclease RusA
MITLRMPWDAPPLRSNDRMHWAKKAKINKQIRTDSAVIGRRWVQECYFSAMRLGMSSDQLWPPIIDPVVVTIIWEVTDRRVRDAGSLAPCLKAAIDGLVDAGCLRADSHDIVTEERLRIEVGTRKGVRIEITEAPKP